MCYNFHIICTFHKSEQIAFELTIDCKKYHDELEEYQFIYHCLEKLTPVQQKELIKISTCQLITSCSDDELPFIFERNGKFWFNNDLAIASIMN